MNTWTPTPDEIATLEGIGSGFFVLNNAHNARASFSHWLRYARAAQPDLAEAFVLLNAHHAELTPELYEVRVAVVAASVTIGNAQAGHITDGWLAGAKRTADALRSACRYVAQLRAASGVTTPHQSLTEHVLGMPPGTLTGQ